MKTGILIRIFDTDTKRLEDSEIALRHYMNVYGVQNVEIQPISCFLEIQRHNKITYVPALEVNGLTISVNKTLTDSMLKDCSLRLAKWQAEKSMEADWRDAEGSVSSACHTTPHSS